MAVPEIDTEALASLVRTVEVRPEMAVTAPATDERSREAQSAWAELVETLQAETGKARGDAVEYRHPKGVVGLITPWNAHARRLGRPARAGGRQRRRARARRVDPLLGAGGRPDTPGSGRSR